MTKSKSLEKKCFYYSTFYDYFLYTFTVITLHLFSNSYEKLFYIKLTNLEVDK